MRATFLLAEDGLNQPPSEDAINIEYHTFGCKVNTYDTGLIQKELRDLSPNKKVHILNTCAVTSEATKDAVRLSKRLKKNNPESLVVVTGCSAQIDKEMFDLDESVDLLVANSHKDQLKDLLQKKLEGRELEKFYHKNIFRQSTLGEGGGLEESHSRSFLKIQDGCNSFCSFCVIPHTRGLSRSLELENLVNKVKEFILMGKKEVVLTGIHLGDYEDSKGNRLEEMIEAVLEQTNLPRLRLTSLEPLELSDRILELSKNPRFCSHFHMSVQSVNTKILKRMKRNYTKEDVLDSFKRAKSVDSKTFIGMDVIVGFPGETEEDFKETYEALKNSPHWDRIHVFPYSERPKTGALQYKDDSVPIVERKKRSKILRELSKKRFHERLKSQVGQTLDTLVLENKISARSNTEGLTQNYWPVVFIDSPKAKAHQIVKAKVIDYDTKVKSFGALIAKMP
jgi:threonylcarbamoyladenosine tRNA methylthiotransferase MtaB